MLDVDGVLVAFGDRDIVAYDPASGDALWCRPRGGQASVMPVIIGSAFAVSTPNAVEAIDAATGQTIWSTPVDGGSGRELSPRGDQVLLLGGGVLRRPDEAPDMPMAVIARLDVATGASVDGAAEAPWLQQVDDTTAVTIMHDFDEIVVTDPATGIERWRASTPFQTSVILDRDLVVVSSLGERRSKVVAYSAADGAVVWEAEVPSPSVLLSGDLVVSGSASDLVALDRSTGQQLWDAHYDTPGRTEQYSEPGWLPAFSSSDGGAAAAGILVATEPHRD